MRCDPQSMSNEELTPRQARFVEEYLIDLNGMQAAIRAGYSPKTAQVQGSRLLSNAKVRAAVEAAKESRAERMKIDADWVLKRLGSEAQADLADIYTEQGMLKPIHEWPLIWRQGLVAGVEVLEEFETVDGERRPVGVVRKVRLSDRIRRLELIGKHVMVQAFRDQVEHSGGVSIVVSQEDAEL